MIILFTNDKYSSNFDFILVTSICNLSFISFSCFINISCFNYYCDNCFKPVHERNKNSNHKKEKIDHFVPIDTHCPAHENIPINLFCIDEKGNIINI